MYFNLFCDVTPTQDDFSLTSQLAVTHTYIIQASVQNLSEKYGKTISLDPLINKVPLQVESTT